MRRALGIVILAAAACGDGTPPPADTAADTVAAAPAPAEPARDWSDSGPFDVRRVREVDFTGDGTAEQLVVTARGTRHDSLDVAVTILGQQRDTLWHGAWPSLLYFKYDRIEGKADTTVARIVRGHVDELLAEDRLRMAGGLPQPLQHDGAENTMRESVRYHLAELDWRRGADLSPADETPPEAYSRIDASTVSMERVD
ncbi:MAG TPA: hypothetical protein VK928_00280, partial [Longimicrobiales bacterium]|nr:hypothetical protein [Longimicrobiales bacterium]